jgi:hypothetical protein
VPGVFHADAYLTQGDESMTELASCGCIKMVNRELAKHNTQIDTVLTFTPAGKLRSRLCVPTTKKDKAKRGTVMKVFATYCPMCGVAIPPDEQSPVSEEVTRGS